VTFNNANFRDPSVIGQLLPERADAGIYGVPSDMLATTAGGQRDATLTIREQGYGAFDPVTTRNWSDYKVVDFGDCPITPGDIQATGRRQRNDVHRILDNVHRAYVLGGDDSINYWNAKALRDHAGPTARIVMLHLDAHHDTNARGVLPDHSTWVADVVEEDEHGHCLVDEVIQVGVRAPGIIDPQVRRTRTLDAAHALAYFRSLLVTPSTVVWLAIDMDVVDPAFAPGVAVPEPFGMTTRELAQIVSEVGPRAKLTTLTEVTPANDVNDITSLLAHRVIERAIMAAGPRESRQLPKQRLHSGVAERTTMKVR
jgi:agmatinase